MFENNIVLLCVIRYPVDFIRCIASAGGDDSTGRSMSLILPYSVTCLF